MKKQGSTVLVKIICLSDCHAFPHSPEHRTTVCITNLTYIITYKPASLDVYTEKHWMLKALQKAVAV